MPEIKIKSNIPALRIQNYPEIGNQLDAIMKGLDAYSKGEPLPQATLDWIEQCKAVKSTYPKE